MWIDYEVALLTLGLSSPITTEFLLGLLDHRVRFERGIAVTTKQKDSLKSFGGPAGI